LRGCDPKKAIHGAAEIIERVRGPRMERDIRRSKELGRAP
jgi:hypothetical protein